MTRPDKIRDVMQADAQTDRHNQTYTLYPPTRMHLKLNYGPLLNGFPVISGPLCGFLVYFSYIFR